MTSEDRVWRALSYVTPKSVAQLAEETGLSEATVRRHLSSLNPETTTMRMSKQLLYSRPELTLPAEPVKLWRVIRRSVTEQVRSLIISESADPVQLADDFLTIGRQLIAIGREIDKVKLDPDWYQRLGGRFWLSDGERNEE